MLEKLIVVCNGEYNRSNGSLTDRGRSNVFALARILMLKLKGSRIAILSSPSIRAEETSLILASCLGVSRFSQHNCFGHRASCLDNSSYAQEAVSLVDRVGIRNDVVIVSTQVHHADFFLSVWAKDKDLSIPIALGTRPATARILYLKHRFVEKVDQHL